MRQLIDKTTSSTVDVKYSAGWKVEKHPINRHMHDVIYDLDVHKVLFNDIELPKIKDQDGCEGWFIPATLIDQEVVADVSSGYYDRDEDSE